MDAAARVALGLELVLLIVVKEAADVVDAVLKVELLVLSSETVALDGIVEEGLLFDVRVRQVAASETGAIARRRSTPL